MVRIYEELLRVTKDKEIHKEYMLKILSIKSSKQSIVDNGIIKPQFKLNCTMRGDDCVFLSMLEKFVYGG